MTAAAVYTGAKIGEFLGEFLYENLSDPLQQLVCDPLILDLDGDGIEVSALDGSAVHFDYGGDGFAERTGWVSADDGLLVIDDNENGRVDGAVELFGSASQDGFAVLETLDGNHDGVIDAQDAAFARLRVWRDLNQDGVSDDGELQTLVQAGIASLSLTRTDLPGTNQGHSVGYGSTFTRADGSTGAAQTIYFQTDRQDTQDNTPPFTPAEGVDALPLLPGSGNIHSIAYKLTFDAAFMAAWTQLTDEAAGLDPSVLHARFEGLLLRWAGVDGVNPYSRGEFVDARHLAFIEAFFGDTYRELVRGEEVRTYPSRVSTGRAVEASFHQIVNVLETMFLAQTAKSLLARGGDIEGALGSPYFFYALLQFSDEEGNPAPASPENVQMVVSLIAQFAPTAPGAAASYLTKALLGLEGMVSVAFDGDRTAYAEAAGPGLDRIADPVLHRIAESIVDGRARVGSTAAEGIRGTSGDDVFLGGGGGDFIDSGAGWDTIVYTRRDGNLWIRDNEGSSAENDKLVLTDLNASDLELNRVGNNLVIKVIATGKAVTVEDFFWHYADRAYGIDSIRFADGTEWDRATIQENSVYRGDSGRNTITDSSLDDVVRGGRGDDFIKIGQGSDTVIYGRGDGSDVIQHTSSSLTERDKLILTDLSPDDVVFSRVGEDILITIKETGEFIRDQNFFFNSSSVTGWRQYSYGFETVQFADGTVWERDQIQRAAWLRGDANANTLSGSGLSETFVGGQGDDVMVGSHGSDTYIWKMGDGNDRISDFSNNASDTDTLVLQDVQSDDVSLSYQGGNVFLTIESTGEVLQLDDLVLGVDNLVTDWSQYRYGIDIIKFADGVAWDRQRIYQQIGADFIGKQTYYRSVYLDGVLINAYWYDEFGHVGDVSEAFENGPNDRFSGGSGNDVMNGSAGHDVLIGYGGNDFIAAGNGNDALYGYDGSDTLLGGDGYDYLWGGEHNDLLDGGDGLDRLDGGSGDDELRGGDGKDYLSGGYGNDTIIGGRGDDVIASFDNGGTATGSDTFIYAQGDGNDSILDETFADYHAGQSDILLLSDLNALDLRFSHSGSDLLIQVLSTGEVIRIVDQFYQTSSTAGRGLELVRFANGEEWNRQRINQEAWYRGTPGKDTISSSFGDDNTISGGLGDDYIVSDRSGGWATGSDTFVYLRGDGNDVISDTTQSTFGPSENDILLLPDLDASDLEFSRSGVDLLINVLSTGETIRIVDQFFESANAAGRGMEFIRFADGEQWGRQQIYREAWYRGTDGRDFISSNAVGDNTFLGGRGNDTITSDCSTGSASGSDTYIYARGDGNDVISDTTQSYWHASESDTLLLSNLSQADLGFVRSGSDLLINVLSTGQVLRIVDQFSESANAAGRGMEFIRFADGDEWGRQTIYGAATAGSGFIVGSRFLNDTLIGGDSQQNIYGEAGDDTLDGRAGSDLLYGGLGNDVLLVSQSAAGEIDTLDGGAGIDTASFASFSAAIWVDLVTSGSEARTRDRVDLSTGTWRGIAEISTVENITGTSFADQLFGDAGANVLIGNAGADALDGRSGNDTLNGGAGSDTLTGGADSDTLLGEEGNDSVLGGMGDDWIDGGAGIDTVVLTGMWSDYAIVANDGSLTVTGLEGADTLTGVEYLTFQDRTVYVGPDNTAPTATWHSYALTQRATFVLTAEELLQGASDADGDSLSISAVSASDHGLVAWTSGTDIRFTVDPDFVGITSFTYTVSDGRGGTATAAVYLTVDPTATVNGTMGNDTFLGLASTETVDGQDGNDTLDGGYGADLLSGDAGDDVLIGGPGADTLEGGSGMDTVSYAAAQAAVAVNLASGTGGSGEAAGDVLSGIENVLGSAFGDDLTGDAGANSLAGGGGNDTLVGGAGADTLDGGAGFDLVSYRNAASAITIDLGTGTKTGDVDATGDVYVGIEGLEGTGSNDKLTGNSAANLLIGNAGNDTLSGGSGSDTLIGGTGNDVLSGGSEGDTYIFNVGDGQDIIAELGSDTTDVLLFGSGISAAQVLVTQAGSGHDLVLSIGTDKVTLDETLTNAIYRVDEVRFANGAIWTYAQLFALATTATGSNDIFYGDERANSLTGGAGNDSLYGASGSDTLTGGAGNDSLSGGNGSDTYLFAQGDGQDIVYDNGFGSGDVDVLQFGAGISAANVIVSQADSGRDLVLTIGTDKVTLDDAIYSTSYRIEEVRFTDGTAWTYAQLFDMAVTATSGNDLFYGDERANSLSGGAGNDTLSGGSGNDTLVGGAGNDSLTGGLNSDTLVFDVGFGADVITDFKAGANTEDVIEFSTAVFSDYAAVLAASTQSGSDVVISASAGNTITLKNVTFSSLHADDFRFV